MKPWAHSLCTWARTSRRHTDFSRRRSGVIGFGSVDDHSSLLLSRSSGFIYGDAYWKSLAPRKQFPAPRAFREAYLAI